MGPILFYFTSVLESELSVNDMVGYTFCKHVFVYVLCTQKHVYHVLGGILSQKPKDSFFRDESRPTRIKSNVYLP